MSFSFFSFFFKEGEKTERKAKKGKTLKKENKTSSFLDVYV